MESSSSRPRARGRVKKPKASTPAEDLTSRSTEELRRELREAAAQVDPARLAGFLDKLAAEEEEAKPMRPRKPKAGRPPLRGVARTAYVAIRLSPAELRALKAHARRAGLGVSPFVASILASAGVLALPR